MEPDALENLERAFTEWRAGRRSQREHVPRELVARARELARHFPEREICRRTALSRGRLFPRQSRGSGAGLAQAPGPTFVELPAAAPSAAADAIEIEVREGARAMFVRFPGSTPFETLAGLLGLLKP